MAGFLGSDEEYGRRPRYAVWVALCIPVVEPVETSARDIVGSQKFVKEFLEFVSLQGETGPVLSVVTPRFRP